MSGRQPSPLVPRRQPGVQRLAGSWLVAALTALAVVQPAQAAEPSPAELHTAECVAALDVSTQALAQDVKAGKEASRALLHERMLAGAALLGDSYLHGASDEKQARELLDRALEAQKSLPAATLAARQAACAAEGNKLYADSNALQQSVVKRLSDRRVNRLLRP